MLEFKTIEILKPNKEIIEIIKNYNYKTKNGKIKHLEKTNLQFIEPTEYRITKPFTLTIYEYKVNEINNKPFYIKEHKQKKCCGSTTALSYSYSLIGDFNEQFF